MIRYFVLATAIVVGTAVVIAGWVHRDEIRIRIASVYASARPKPQASARLGMEAQRGLRGDAPWALSAFPECATQTSETTGSLAYVLAHVPRGLPEVSSPATLSAGNCTIALVGDVAYVRRGADRYRIPPHVRLFSAPGRIAVLRSDPSGGNELRVYEVTRAVP